MDGITCTLQWSALSLENCPFPWGTWTTFNMFFLGATRVHTPKDISIGSAVFTGLTVVTDRQIVSQTDHAARSVTTGRIYVQYVVLRCYPPFMALNGL